MRRPVSFVCAVFLCAAWLLQVFSLLPLFSDGNQTQARWLWRDTLRFSDRARERELIERSAGATSASTFKISSPPGSPCTCCLFRYEHATAPALTGSDQTFNLISLIGDLIAVFWSGAEGQSA